MYKSMPIIYSIWNRSSKKSGFGRVIERCALIGGSLGISAMIVVMAIIDGFHKELKKNFLGVQGEIVILPKQGDNYVYMHVTKVLNKKMLELGIKRIVPVNAGRVLLTAGNSRMVAKMHGIPQSYFQGVPFLPSQFSESRDMPTIYMGKKIAEKLKVKIGSNIDVTTEQLTVTPIGLIPNNMTFNVAGIVNTGSVFSDEFNVYTDLRASNPMLIKNSATESVNYIECHLTDDRNLTKKIKTIADCIKDAKLKNYKVVDSLANHHMLKALEVEKISMFIVIVMLILVVVFNITTVLYILTQAKSRDIAILNTLGANPKCIILSMVLFGAKLAAWIAAFGFMSGMMFLYYLKEIKEFLENIFLVKIFDPDVYHLNEIPYSLTGLTLLIPILIIILAAIVSIFPALRAVYKDPVEVFRNA